MAISYVNRGTTSAAAGNVGLAPAYPGAIAAGNLLILTVQHINEPTQLNAVYAPAPSDGWIAGGQATGSQSRVRFWYKMATGSESGTTAITVTGGVPQGLHKACIDQWAGVDQTTTPIYGLSSSGVFSQTVTDAAVAVAAPGDVAVNYLAISNAASTVEDFTGETGGPGAWTKVTEDEATRPYTGLWMAAFSAAGTIDGGSFDATTGSGWAVQGFAIRAANIVQFTIPQAASLLRSMWLDGQVALSRQDSAQILGLYRYEPALVASPFTLPQAASILRVPWLDAPAAFSREDGAQILGLYRFAPPAFFVLPGDASHLHITPYEANLYKGRTLFGDPIALVSIGFSPAVTLTINKSLLGEARSVFVGRGTAILSYTPIPTTPFVSPPYGIINPSLLLSRGPSVKRTKLGVYDWKRIR